MVLKPAFYRLPEEKQKSLLDIAVRLYIEHPYEEVTARLLCKSMEINPATFYRYFDSKDDLLFHLVRALNKKSLAYHMEELERMGVDENSYFPAFSKEKPDYYTEQENAFLLACNRFPKEVIHDITFRLAGSNQAYYREILKREQAAGKLRQDVDIDLIAYMYATTGYNLMTYCMERGMDQEAYVKRKIYFYYDFFYHGILERERKREP